jgi:hypothetical protein
LYSVAVTPVPGWRSQKGEAVTVQTGTAPRNPVPDDAEVVARERA